MTKKKFTMACTECGQLTSKWVGRCTSCNSWNTIEEIKPQESLSISKEMTSKRLIDVQTIDIKRLQTEINEVDNVFGGGIAKGSFNLISGDPGVGKSTLLMEICRKLSKLKVLYISGEESSSQIALRAKRMNVKTSNIYVLHETSWQVIKEEIKKVKPELIILDSIQTTHSQEVNSAAGSVSQVREITYELLNQSKSMGITTFVIGHVTKDGGIAGPKILEHMVDTAIHFEGEKESQYRVLRVLKNRFGSTNEIGILKMDADGLKEVLNIKESFGNFVEKQKLYGQAKACNLEGSRVMFFDVEALVVENKFGTAKRVTQGLDLNRLNIIVAIIEKYFEIPLSTYDIYINVVGGFKNNHRDTDIAFIAAILSSYYQKNIKPNLICMGEVGLTGNLKPVKNLEIRLKSLAHVKNVETLVGMKNCGQPCKRNKVVEIKKAIEIKDYLFV